MSTTTAAPSGMILRDLGKNDAGFRSHLVSWRGEFFRVSWKREPRGFALAGKDEKLRTGTTVSLVVLRADKDGAELADAAPLSKELLEELQGIGRTLAAWSGA